MTAFPTRTVARGVSTGLAVLLIGLVAGIGSVLFGPSIPFFIIGVLSFFLIWIMPEIAIAPEKFGRFVLYIFAFLIIATPQYYAIVVPGLPWLSPRRIFLFVCAALTLITLGGSSVYRAKLFARGRQLPWLWAALVGYLGILGLSSCQSVSPGSSLNDTANTLLSSYLPLFAVVLFVNTYSQIETLILWLVSGAFVAALLGSIEYRLQHPFLYKLLPMGMRQQIAAMDPMAPMGLVPRSVSLDGSVRAASTFMVPLSWAEMAMMLAPLTLHLLVSGSRPAIRFMGVFAQLAIVLSLFCAGSRGGYVGYIAGCLFYLAICAGRIVIDDRVSMRGPIINVLFCLGAGAIVGSILFVGRVHKAILGSGVRLTSDEARHEQWMMAIPKILSRPILGYGPSTANNVVGYFTLGGNSSLDSYFINVLVSTGIVGFAVYLMIFAAPIVAALNFRAPRTLKLFSMRTALTASLAGYLLYRTTLNQTENNTLLFLELGLLTVTTILGRSEKTAPVQTVEERHPQSRRLSSRRMEEVDQLG